MSEFSGDAGTIYVEKSGDKRGDGYEVWFEDFYILGKGGSEREALEDAALHAASIQLLITRAMSETPSTKHGRVR